MMQRQLLRAAARPVRIQRRTFLDWMTNYPDKVMEMKKYHKAHKDLWTWYRMPNDKYINWFGVGLVTFGVAQLVPAYYRLATGKGKMD